MGALRAHAATVLALGLFAGAAQHGAPALAARPPDLSGTWAMQGTGPAGLVASGGRIATIALRQSGKALQLVLRSGGHAYHGSGTVLWPKPLIVFTWRMPGAGLCQFSGAMQAGNTRILGAWHDARGNDGGAFLVRQGR